MCQDRDPSSLRWGRFVASGRRLRVHRRLGRRSQDHDQGWSGGGLLLLLGLHSLAARHALFHRLLFRWRGRCSVDVMAGRRRGHRRLWRVWKLESRVFGADHRWRIVLPCCAMQCDGVMYNAGFIFLGGDPKSADAVPRLCCQVWYSRGTEGGASRDMSCGLFVLVWQSREVESNDWRTARCMGTGVYIR